jgi:GNAT superfamily N-acetyltransferase
MTTIRAATTADLPALVTMGRRFLAMLYTDRLKDAPDRLDALASQLVGDANSLVLVSEQAGEVVGMIAMVCYEHPMSGDPMAVEMFWWVEPEQRGDGMRLFRRARAWAKARGARILQMIAPATNPDVAAMYDRLGFVPMETTYQRSL